MFLPIRVTTSPLRARLQDRLILLQKPQSPMEKPARARENRPVTPAILTLQQPRTLVFGAGCLASAAQDLLAQSIQRVFVVASPQTRALGEPLLRGAAGRQPICVNLGPGDS